MQFKYKYLYSKMKERIDEKENIIDDDNITNIFLNNIKKKRNIHDNQGINHFRSKICFSLNNKNFRKIHQKIYAIQILII